MRTWPRAAAAGIALGLVGQVSPVLAAQRPDPSAGDVRESKEEVRERKSAVAKAKVRIAKADAGLDRLVAKAESLVEAYNGEVVKLRHARTRYARAQERVRAAKLNASRERERVASMAAKAYTGSHVNPQAAMVAGQGGPRGYISRLGTVEFIGGHQNHAVKEAEAAQRVSGILGTLASKALSEQQRSASKVRAAKAAAQRAVKSQEREIETLEARKKSLERRLNAASRRSDRMERARDAARERRMGHTPQRSGSWGSAARLGSSRGAIAARWALTQLGKPYLWAGAGPDRYDCSGLTMRAWEKVGVRLDHWTGTQWTSGPHVPTGALKPGDLVFFGYVSTDPGTIHHVGMYIGGGKMVHAPQTGDVIKISPIWRGDMVGATRPAD